MNILVLLGSPVKDGNTTKVINMLRDELQSEHSFEVVRVADMHIEFCEGCNGCQNSSELLSCKHRDDFNSIVEKMKLADLVIYASPLYVYSFPAQFKKFIDRMYSTIHDFKTAKAKSYLEGTKQMLLLTAIGPKLVCSPCINIFKFMSETQKGTSLGEFVVPFCKSEKRIQRNGMYAIKDMAKAIKEMNC